ncbi:hypothetical protein BIV02_11705 [Curtobacterium sp. MMLR14_014]|uniref:Eco57I restriction-modification methylase domain-containing protein n=1 Tax=unclassified Curtobacterium TaxID=257496 RepID=UPI0008F8CEB4|nr:MULTISPECIES: Eco57I restriction-modification methylase domain-containing protein [unclassified Curtobacterium]OII39064.1 hypothetical protein BIU91_09710 [Curtobacterium sp. MMLR14_002]OII45628.1 hypothetical protein BIV02_11705 [Curtobacterium sp. MMLR14_014]
MTANEELIERLIVGRVRPRIYAFSTNTVPNYLKVGDTYRPIATRLNEWRHHYPNLEQHFEGSASVSEDVYFRDHSVHRYLEDDLGRMRLLPEEISIGEYYSREFFGGATAADVEAAIEDIRNDHAENLGRYAYFDAADRLPAVRHYARGEEWELRPNQREAVDAFEAAVTAGRSNLLMYAVMRFGKTFTSLMCAKRLAARTVLVVSAKADVKGEWKQTAESAGNFAGYVFLDAEALMLDPEAVTEARANSDCVVIFLTLQDLQGPDLKEKHADVFNKTIDLLIIDETHFGARAGSYGQVLRDARQPVDSEEAALSAEQEDFADAEKQLKVLQARIRLHLSGSPYRILMGGEFGTEDIIAFVQFADIVREQEQWNVDHPDANEWENPYFGFPQMVRFAFHPNESALHKLSMLKKSGYSYAFTALLKPRQLTRDRRDGLHKEFEHEAEILDLLRVIDGSQQDQNVLGILDNDRIRQGQLCRHMVMVLPYKASCDAMQTLIERNAEKFKNLKDYEIINISGVDDIRRFPTPDRVKAAISDAEAEGRKTLTLTVNRMLTGTTVQQWDTMLYLKDTASPQEYDQATFRLQSQHVRTLGSEKSAEIIKENLKPQTLLVDFDPVRLFRLQELRSLLSSENGTDAPVDSDLGTRLREDLRISPVITMNADRLSEVTPTDVLHAISEYNMNRSVADEVRDVPVDLNVLAIEEIRRVIAQQASLGSKEGLTLAAVEGEEHDLDTGGDDGEPAGPGGDDPGSSLADPHTERDDADWEAKLQTYYQRILFFAMLTSDSVTSLRDVVDVIDMSENARIARNLGLEPVILRALLGAFDRIKLKSLDYKILNISRLTREESLTPVERATGALAKFTRVSESEVRTPLWLCREIVGRIPGAELRALVERGEKVLDLASKFGEFAVAIYQRLVDELGVNKAVASAAVYSLPTSSIAYEFTRRFYEILGLDTDNIANGPTAYDLLKERGLRSIERIFDEGSSSVKFGAVVGNPPYQVSDGGAQQSARPIYPEFIAAAAALEPKYMSFVIPSRWYAGGKQLGDFRNHMLADTCIRELHDFPTPETVFPETNNRGGVCYFLRDSSYDAAEAGGTLVLTRDGQDVEFEATRPLNTFGLGIFLRDSKGVEIVQKVTNHESFASFEDQVSARRPFGLEGSIVNSPEFHDTPAGLTEPVLCYGKSRKVGYLSDALIRTRLDWIGRWKAMTPYANNIGTELNDDNQNAFVAAPGSVCSETFIVMGADLDLTEESAHNLVAYVKTKFARFLHGKAKVSQHGTKSTYRFVPQVDLSAESAIDWSVSSEQIDEQLFDLYELSEEEREYIRSSIKTMRA